MLFRSNAAEALEKIGMTGFEPAAPSSRTKCATKLRYIPLAGSLRDHPPGTTSAAPKSRGAAMASAATAPANAAVPTSSAAGARTAGETAALRAQTSPAAMDPLA